MHTKILLILIALAELVAGACLLFVPSNFAGLFFGEALNSDVALLVGRLAGLALVAMGLTCWLEKPGSDGSLPFNQLAGLLFYNGAVTVLFVYSFFINGSGGPLLWPAAILHAAFTIWLALVFKISAQKTTTGR